MKRRLRCGGRPITAVVLAGGRGRRMGADKARLPLPGGTLLGRVLRQLTPHFDEVLVSVSPGQEVELEIPPPKERGGRRPGPKVVEDATRGQGPMAGVLTGLQAAANDAVVVVACDIPDVDMRFVRRLVAAAAGADIAVSVTRAGDFEPLLAVYTKAVIPEIERLLRSGERSLIPLFGRSRTTVVPLGNAGWLRNLNTRRDYEDYLRTLDRKPKAARSGPARRGRTGRRA